jgi:hypothetical protein
MVHKPQNISKAKVKGIHQKHIKVATLEKQVKENGRIYKNDSDSKMMQTNNNVVTYATTFE